MFARLRLTQHSQARSVIPQYRPMNEIPHPCPFPFFSSSRSLPPLVDATNSPTFFFLFFLFIYLFSFYFYLMEQSSMGLLVTLSLCCVMLLLLLLPDGSVAQESEIDYRQMWIQVFFFTIPFLYYPASIKQTILIINSIPILLALHICKIKLIN